MVHYHGRFYLPGLGCSIWLLAVLLSGLARYVDSCAFLVLARKFSGDLCAGEFVFFSEMLLLK